MKLLPLAFLFSALVGAVPAEAPAEALEVRDALPGEKPCKTKTVYKYKTVYKTKTKTDYKYKTVYVTKTETDYKTKTKTVTETATVTKKPYCPPPPKPDCSKDCPPDCDKDCHYDCKKWNEWKGKCSNPKFRFV